MYIEFDVVKAQGERAVYHVEYPGEIWSAEEIREELEVEEFEPLIVENLETDINEEYFDGMILEELCDVGEELEGWDEELFDALLEVYAGDFAQFRWCKEDYTLWRGFESWSNLGRHLFYEDVANLDTDRKLVSLLELCVDFAKYAENLFEGYTVKQFTSRGFVFGN